jgi:hypothetical protein
MRATRPRRCAAGRRTSLGSLRGGGVERVERLLLELAQAFGTNAEVGAEAAQGFSTAVGGSEGVRFPGVCVRFPTFTPTAAPVGVFVDSDLTAALDVDKSRRPPWRPRRSIPSEADEGCRWSTE